MIYGTYTTHLFFWLVALVYLPLPAAGQPTAVVIGIADFQDPAITDLGYADADALAFANFLRDPGGGGLAADRIKILTDSSATLAAIQSALAWQLETAGSDTHSYLYLATHGDVETSDSTAAGYLLAYDTPRNNYNLLALSVGYLDAHLAALAAKGVTAVIVTDACHAGTLAGDAVAGRRLTTARLMQRRGSEIRMLACQPYELSHEGARWGGGRGVFSYYLLEGMRGAADEDRDRRVDLLELERYVQDHVSTDTDRAQHPELFGGRKDLALFNVASDGRQAHLVSQAEDLQADLVASALGLASEQAQRDYLHFIRAVDAGALLYPEGQSALAYYRSLRGQPKLITLRGLLDERLTVALLDSVQQAIRAYLDTDAGELLQREQLDGKYRQFSAYLTTAADILGEQDPRYSSIQAKRAYFEGVILRLQADRGDRDTATYRQALTQLERAVALEPAAAYLHNELGLLHLRLDQVTEGYYSFQRAIELAPTWALPYNNLASLLSRNDLGVYGEVCQEYYRTATRLKPDFASAYMNWGNLLLALGRADTAELLLRQSVALAPEYHAPTYNLAILLHRQAGRAEAAIPLFRGLIERGVYLPQSYLSLAEVHYQREATDSAEINLRRALALQPDYPAALGWWRTYAMETGRPELARGLYDSLLARRPDLPVAYLELMLLDTTDGRWLRRLRHAPLPDALKAAVATELAFKLYASGQRAAAASCLQLSARLLPRATNSHVNLAAFYSITDRNKEAVAALRQAFRVAGPPEGMQPFCGEVARSAKLNQLLTLPAAGAVYAEYCGGPPPPD